MIADPSQPVPPDPSPVTRSVTGAKPVLTSGNGPP